MNDPKGDIRHHLSPAIGQMVLKVADQTSVELLPKTELTAEESSLTVTLTIAELQGHLAYLRAALEACRG